MDVWWRNKDVVAVINANPSRNDDELHRLIRKFYRNKVRHNQK